MYRQEDAWQYELENFYLPFGGHLDSENRWVRLTKLIPWEEFEEEYSHHFTEEWKGGKKGLATVILGSGQAGSVLR